MVLLTIEWESVNIIVHGPCHIYLPCNFDLKKTYVVV